ncbi:MAG TPA: mechanosensitive ion channel family protein [Candidatus Desulfaltia sp.]|nr:mechanosensitive ion channel family protein [Candidatus Desulfaltia sp.]
MNTLLKSIDAELVYNTILRIIPDVLAALAVLFGFWLLFRLTRKPARFVLEKANIHKNLIDLLIDNLYKFVLVVFAVIMAASQVGLNVGAMLAGIGVAGIALGFAAQDSLANSIAGFLIFWDKPFEVGDLISVAGEYGQVKEITLRSTRIRTLNNTFVVLPNKGVIDQVLVNHSKHGETRIEVPVGIAYKEHIPDARKVILEMVRGLEGVLQEPAPDVVVKQLGPSSVDLIVRVWIKNARYEMPIFYRVMEASKLALDAAGIQIPYHHLQLFIESIDDKIWEKAAQLSRLPSAGAIGRS